MRRRDFLGVLASAGTGWSPHVQAQQPLLPIVGFVFTGSSPAAEPLLLSFDKGLPRTDMLKAGM